MGYARHIGRVGALAVTLGVGVAIVTTPGIAYADPSGSSTSTGGSSSAATSSSTSTGGSSSTATSSAATSSATGKSSAGTSSATGRSSATGKSSSTATSSAGTDAASTDGSDGADPSASDLKSPSGSADESTLDSDKPAGNDTKEDVEEAGEGGDGEEPTSGGGDEDTPPGAGDKDTPPATDDEDAAPTDAAPAQVDDSVQDPVSDDSADQQTSNRSASAHAFGLSDASDHVDSTGAVAAGQPTRSGRQQLQTFSIAAEADAPVRYSLAPASTDVLTSDATTPTAAAATSVVPAPSAPQRRPTLVGVVSEFVAAVLQPILSPGKGSPIQMPILSAVLAAWRNEFERVLFPRKANMAPQQTVALLKDPPTRPSLPVDPTEQHVLVIGVDGTNLSRILADDYNQNFFDLMDTSTTAASSIVGHTTISNPSWTAILTGEWGEKTGVINNVFTPWTYDNWPTVYNQLETLNPKIQTMAIADWNVINAIAGAGSIPADENVFVPQIEGDTNWLQTDDAVADRTVDAILGINRPAPNFLFSYFVGVDENGHMFGGASPQYAEAIRNIDDNLGEILDAVAAWEAAHPGEDWTVIVVTDHGHQPQQGFGHGFQSPDETATFVIADGPAFRDGYINLQYEIVDTTPTVVTSLRRHTEG